MLVYQTNPPVGKEEKKLWRCVGREYYKIIWFDQPG